MKTIAMNHEFAIRRLVAVGILFAALSGPVLAFIEEITSKQP